MGIDFVQKRAPSFERSWDRNRNELAQPSLLNLEPKLQDQTYRAIAKQGFVFTPGDKMLVHFDGENLILTKEMTVVANILEPTQLLLGALARANGVAVGTVQNTLVDGEAADVSIN
jgi:hypothetical protein